MEVKIRKLKKSYGTRTVLDVKELEIQPGCITAVVGPNGAGKTTFLAVLAGLLEKDGGEILYDGKKELPYREVTMVFQKPCLISASVRKNISWPLKIRRMEKSQITQRVEQLAEDLGLTPLLERSAGRLSAGEAQKTALARALSFEPGLLLLDEPGANIDPEALVQMEQILLKMKEQKKTTILLVTHNLAQARRMSDQMILMERGGIIENSPTDRFFSKPERTETKQFLEHETVMEMR